MHDGFMAIHHAYMVKTLEDEEPTTFEEVAQKEEQIQAMKEELAALHHQRMWKLVPLPKGKHTIGCKWVYKIKTLADGSIEKYKARLVARGFTQQHGLDYWHTFAPVARYSTIRIMFAIAVLKDWKILSVILIQLI